MTRGPLLRPALGGKRTPESEIRNVRRQVEAMERRMDAQDALIEEMKGPGGGVDRLTLTEMMRMMADIADLKTDAARRKGGRPRKDGPKVDFDETTKQISEQVHADPFTEPEASA